MQFGILELSYSLKFRFCATSILKYVCVCMFAIGSHAVRLIGLKFGTEVALHLESVIGHVQTGEPPPGWGWPRSSSRGLCCPNHAFSGKLNKTKVGKHHRCSEGGSGQIRRRTSLKWPGGPSMLNLRV